MGCNFNFEICSVKELREGNSSKDKGSFLPECSNWSVYSNYGWNVHLNPITTPCR